MRKLWYFPTYRADGLVEELPGETTLDDAVRSLGRLRERVRLAGASASYRFWISEREIEVPPRRVASSQPKKEAA